MKLSQKLKYILPLFAGLFFSGNFLSAQLQTTGGQTANDLVQNVLLGSGVELISVNFQGNTTAIGTFDGTSSNIGLNEGVIMTTGTISGPQGPVGPNNLPNAGMDNGTPGYPLLQNIVGAQTFNATVIQFTFIPQGDSINFKYVFASEEYKEFVGTEFNDIFGFFLNGPNPSGGNYVNRNLALVPSSITPVAINNVNHLTNTSYYVDNDPPSGATVQYDGFTKVMIAKASVVPCSTYTITLAIADVGDPIYDSGVFLEAKSFSSKGSDVDHEIVNSFNADTLYESCGQANVTFTLTGNNSGPTTVQYQFLGTATNGVDYTVSPAGNSITIPNGQTTGNIVITPINDGVSEGLEYIIVQIVDTTICPNVQLPRDTIYLQNVNPLTVVARPDTNFNCNNEVLMVWATAAGGAGNITLTWSDGIGQGNYIPIIARNSETYVVTAVDQCGTSTATDSFSVFVPNIPPLSLSFNNDTAICPGTPVQLTATIGGGIGDLNLGWSTGESNIYTKLVVPDETTLYTVILSDSCGNTLTDGALITVLAPSVSFTYSYVENRTLQFYAEASQDVVSYEWNFGDGGSSTEQNPEHTFADTGYFNVRLVVTNEFGCTDTAFDLIYAHPDFRFFIPNTFTPNVDGLNDVFTGRGMGFTKYEMRIFNRWGQEIFYTNDILRGWPGIDADHYKCPIGVYAYRVDLETPANLKYRYIGHVNLLR